MTRTTLTMLGATLSLFACGGPQAATPLPKQPAPPAVQMAEPLPAPSPEPEVVQPTAPTPTPKTAPEPVPAPEVKVERIGPADDSVEATGGVPQLRQRVLASQRTWAAELRKHGGSYSYTTGFGSWVGFGHEKRVTIANGKAVEQTYLAYDRDNAVTEQWIERGDEVGKHNRGSQPQTIDQMYEECLNVVLKKDPKDHAFYVAFFKNGLLADCSYRHKQCADDCSEGPEIHTIRWQ